MLASYDGFSYFTNDKGYYEGIPMGIAEPYPSDMSTVKNIFIFISKKNRNLY